MKIDLEELIEQVKDEILCYEDMEEVAEEWGAEFLKWAEKNKGHHKDIIQTPKGLQFKISDEEEIFEMADSYVDAVEEGMKEAYWQTFS